jgi:transposase
MFRYKVVLSRTTSPEVVHNKFMTALRQSGLSQNTADFLAEQVGVAINRCSHSRNYSNSVFEGDGYKVAIVSSQNKGGLISKLLGIFKGK